MTNPNPRSPLQKFSRTALALPLILLASCGGGGSDDSDSATTPGGDTTRCLKTHSGHCLTEPELAARARQLTTAMRNSVRSIPGGAQNWARDAVNAYEGYAHVNLMRGGTAGASPGAGVHIGILDTGIELGHPDFAGLGAGSRTLEESAAREPLFSESHGTAVASAAVGVTSGIAWGADMTMFSAKNPDPRRGDYVPLTADLYQRALNENLDILNMSLGYGPGQINYRSFSGNVGAIETSWTESQVRDFYGSDILNVWAQPGVSDKTIMVWAAGNNHGANGFNAHSPGLDAGAVRFIPELRGHWVTVVATDRSGNIADFSNRCGIAASWCIAAPGERVRVASYDVSGVSTNLYEEINGTSFAAPMVSGGLAVMKQLFRGQLSNEELVDRLFATAKKTGIHGNQAIYGQGLMDLGAATNPWGIPAFMGAAGATPISSTSLTLGAPFGDGLANALASHEVVAFDSLGAPFWFEAASFTALSEGASLATRLNDFLHPAQLRSIPETWQFNLKENATATEIGHLALANGASRLAIAGPQGVSAMLFQDPQELEGLTLAWTPRTFDAFTVEAGYLNEHQSLLGSHGEGAGGRFSGETLFLGAGLNVMAGNWQLAAQGEVGHVTPAVAHSQFIKEISSLSTSSFRLAASRPFANGSALHFSLSQPLRVESGSFTHNLVASGAHALSLDQAVSDPLAPQGRQLDLTARLDLPWLGGDLSLGATRSAQPRHQQSAAPEWTLFTGYRSTW